MKERPTQQCAAVVTGPVHNSGSRCAKRTADPKGLCRTHREAGHFAREWHDGDAYPDRMPFLGQGAYRYIMLRDPRLKRPALECDIALSGWAKLAAPSRMDAHGPHRFAGATLRVLGRRETSEGHEYALLTEGTDYYDGSMPAGWVNVRYIAELDVRDGSGLSDKVKAELHAQAESYRRRTAGA